MKCDYCAKNAVYKNEKKYECSSHFIKRFEKTVLNTIKSEKLITKTDKIIVGLSGGKDSLAVLYILKKNYKNQIQALLVDEGIKGYREHTTEIAKKYCKEWGVKLIIRTFKDETGKTLDQIKELINNAPCYPCGVFRREILNKTARELKFTKMVSGHNLDDEVQAIMMNFFMGDVNRQTRMGYTTGKVKNKGFIPRIKPLRNLTEKQIMLYNQLMNFTQSFIECPNVKESYRIMIRDYLNDYENKHPGTKKNILNSYEGWIRKRIKTHVTQQIINDCEICEEPTSGIICKTCKLKKMIK